jgi:hypothetical protein
MGAEMADERLLDEEHYFRTRAADLASGAERLRISRRALIGAAAAGTLLAGSGRWSLPAARAEVATLRSHPNGRLASSWADLPGFDPDHGSDDNARQPSRETAGESA